MNNISKQQGGTVLGLIIGLIIGLGIALGVAVTINNTPIPFTNKVTRQDRNAANGGAAVDPNKPLYGNKTAAKEAAKNFVKEAPAEKQAALASEAKADGKAPVVDLSSTAKKKTEVKTVEVSPAEARDAVKEVAAKPDNADEKWSYYLQAGAFRDVIDAENTRAKLALMGVEAKVTERQSENGTLYRVRIGPFAQLDAMNRVRGKLSDSGVDAAVVRVAR